MQFSIIPRLPIFLWGVGGRFLPLYRGYSQCILSSAEIAVMLLYQLFGPHSRVMWHYLIIGRSSIHYFSAVRKDLWSIVKYGNILWFFYGQKWVKPVGIFAVIFFCKKKEKNKKQRIDKENFNSQNISCNDNDSVSKWYLLLFFENFQECFTDHSSNYIRLTFIK